MAAKRVNVNNIHYTATFDILNVPPAITKHIHVECGKKVKRLLVKNNLVYGLEVEDKHGIAEYKAKQVIVAAGAFDSTQLLFDSNIRPQALGHYLHFHPLLMAQVILKDQFRRKNHHDQPPRTCIYPTQSHPWHTMVLRDIFPSQDLLALDNNILIDMQIFIPIEVQEQNKMILTNKKPRFSVHLSKQDQYVIDAARQDVHSIGAELGTFRNGAQPRLFDFGFTHPMGMCRLGEDPKTSVTDRYGKVHGLDNLYLATVGVIPTQMAVNPTLTAIALAMGTVEHMTL